MGSTNSGQGAGDIHAAARGVDGDPATCAQAGNEWAWAYDVNLLRVEKLNRVVIAFGEGYATEFEVLAALDGAKWQKLGAMREQKGGRVEIKFPPTKVRILRVRASKPDGPGQPGHQMSIAELEAYE